MQTSTTIINSFGAFKSPAETPVALRQWGNVEALTPSCRITQHLFGGVTYLAASFAVLCRHFKKQRSWTTFQAHFSAFTTSDPFLSILQAARDPHLIFPWLHSSRQRYFSHTDSFCFDSRLLITARAFLSPLVAEARSGWGRKAPLETV